MRLWKILAVLSILSFGSQDAFAARAAARERQAKKACLSGDYVKGVSILAELYVETEEPTYLYNQGRCYEQNVRYVEAAERFREYMRKARRMTAKEKADAEKHIAECEAAIAKTRAIEPVQPPPPPPAPVAPQPVPTPEPVMLQQTPVLQPATEGSPWQHTAKWIAAGAAVGFLGLGVFEHLRYYDKNNDFNDDPTCPDGPGCKGLADSADTAQLVAIVGYGAAAVATGLAVTFFLTDKPASVAASSAQSAIAVTCTPALAGVTCAGRF